MSVINSTVKYNWKGCKLQDAAAGAVKNDDKFQESVFSSQS